jgi:hypothetical protein
MLDGPGGRAALTDLDRSDLLNAHRMDVRGSSPVNRPKSALTFAPFWTETSMSGFVQWPWSRRGSAAGTLKSTPVMILNTSGISVLQRPIACDSSG